MADWIDDNAQWVIDDSSQWTGFDVRQWIPLILGVILNAIIVSVTSARDILAK